MRAPRGTSSSRDGVGGGAVGGGGRTCRALTARTQYFYIGDAPCELDAAVPASVALDTASDGLSAPCELDATVPCGRDRAVAVRLPGGGSPAHRKAVRLRTAACVLARAVGCPWPTVRMCGRLRAAGVEPPRRCRGVALRSPGRLCFLCAARGFVWQACIQLLGAVGILVLAVATAMGSVRAVAAVVVHRAVVACADVPLASVGVHRVFPFSHCTSPLRWSLAAVLCGPQALSGVRAPCRGTGSTLRRRGGVGCTRAHFPGAT